MMFSFFSSILPTFKLIPYIISSYIFKLLQIYKIYLK